MSDPAQSEIALKLVDRYWEDLLEIEPILATEVGDERYDDRLPDPSEDGREHRRQTHGAALAALATIDTTAVDPMLRGTLDVLEAICRRDLANIEARMDRLEVISHLGGPGQLLGVLASLQRADTPERLERYLGRLRAVPAYVDAVIPIMEEGTRLGVTVPDVVADRSIAQVERLLAAGAEGSPALTPAGDDPDGRGRVAEIVKDAVLPAYARYLDALRAYRPHATETIGLSALPDGDRLYAAQILAWTTLPLDAREVHELGRQELAGIQDERRDIARALGHAGPEEAIAGYEASGRAFASSREEMVRIAEDQVQRGWDAAPSFFGRMPEANCQVRPVEEYREPDMPFAFYMSPSADGSRAGIYYVNTSDLSERPLHHLATTTYHEANPGHHLQVSIEQELPERPQLRRFGGFLAGSAFGEGWGLYCERLADEMGLFEDEYERLGMLDAQGMRAARLIVDTGIHALGWDRERSIAQMVEAGVAKLDAEIETDRYIAMPGQALSYKIGQREIERWRRDATARDGTAFDLKAFHDHLLSLGSLPLPALRREMGSDG